MTTLFGKFGSVLSLFLVLALGSLAGCGGSSGDDPAPGGGDDVVNDDPGDDDDQEDQDDSEDDPVDEPLTCNNPTYDEALNLRIYQVMTESFINGNPSIGHGVGYGTSHHMGDIQGITDSLEYIKDLGFNAIWLTPIFDSVPLPEQDLAADRLDATGYYASNFFAIDPNFGSLDEARELVEKAHELGLYVFFDGVFGHFKSNAQDYPSREDHTLSTGGDSVAGTGRLALYPDDLEFFKEVATFWIEELKIDGWRLDQAYQVPLDAWVDIRRAVEQTSAEVTYTNADGDTVNPLGYMVAEIWKGPGEIAAEGYGTAEEPALCSAFDFPMRYALVRSLAVEENGGRTPSAGQLNTGFASHNNYPEHARPNGFLGNHDLVRFGDLLQRGDIAGPEEDSYWQRHKAAYSFLAAYTGPITLYYGEEIGQELADYADEVTANCADQGRCDDHVARTDGMIKGMPSGSEHAVFTANERQADLRGYLSELMHLRAREPALYRGERLPVTVPADIAGDLYADYKAHEDEGIVYLLNVSDTAVTASFDACALGSAGDLTNLLTDEIISVEEEQYQIQVPATTGVFLKVNEPLPEGPGCGGSSGPVGEGPLAACDAPTVDEAGPLENETVYIRGTYAGGNAFDATPSDRSFSYKGDNIYQVVVTEDSATDYTFKFATSDWSREYAVAGSAAVTIGQEQALATASGPGTESAIQIPEAADYVFSFQLDNDLEGGTMMVSQCAP